jgi:hypothetical protein
MDNSGFFVRRVSIHSCKTFPLSSGVSELRYWNYLQVWLCCSEIVYGSVSFDNKYWHTHICKEGAFLIWCLSSLFSINWTLINLSLLSDTSCCAVYFGPALDGHVISPIPMKSLLLLSHALSRAVITGCTLITITWKTVLFWIIVCVISLWLRHFTYFTEMATTAVNCVHIGI